ncbi:hypothetical protein [Nocardia gipuzkoensis]
MTNTLSDLDVINADLMGGNARNAFGKDIEPGAQVSGEIVAAVRRQRRDRSGQPLFWVNRKPMTTPNGSPVIDSILILQTDAQDDEQDDGLRSLYLDRDVQRALAVALRRAKANGVAIGGRIEGFMYVGPNPDGGFGRVYDSGTYTAPEGK